MLLVMVASSMAIFSAFCSHVCGKKYQYVCGVVIEKYLLLVGQNTARRFLQVSSSYVLICHIHIIGNILCNKHTRRLCTTTTSSQIKATPVIQYVVQ